LSPSVNFLEMIGGGRVPVELIGTWIVMGILLVFAFAARRALAAAPDPSIPDEGFSLRSMAEVIIEQLDNFVHGVMETKGHRVFVPYLGSLFLFILVANLFGLIPGMEPPTSFSNLTFALGAISFCYFIYHGIKAQRLGYVKNELVGPLWLLAPLMLPINLADNLFRPFSLGVRLYANMFADHKVLSIFTGLTRLVVPIAFYTLGAIVCVIQALIFMVLTMSYVRLARGHGEEHH
jgi:F-type H+-transporting ATPase subunit a